MCRAREREERKNIFVSLCDCLKGEGEERRGGEEWRKKKCSFFLSTIAYQGWGRKWGCFRPKKKKVSFFNFLLLHRSIVPVGGLEGGGDMGSMGVGGGVGKGCCDHPSLFSTFFFDKIVDTTRFSQIWSHIGKPDFKKKSHIWGSGPQSLARSLAVSTNCSVTKVLLRRKSL